MDKNYTQLETFFGGKLETSLYREECKDFIFDNISEFRGTTAAVGGSVYTGAFELARALVEYGFDVRYIFVNVVTDFDTEHLQWLKE